MLSIAKIHSQRSQAKGRSAAGYLHYLGKPAPRERGFEAYARGRDEGPRPFWACKGPALLGLGAEAEAQHVERLAQGLHPVTGAALVKGSGRGHVAGLDLTFSAPKDVSAVFAGADGATREAILEAMRESARAALDHAERAALTRHGKGGAEKRPAEAAVAACFQHFASRAGQPQLHVHSLLFNVVKREGSPEWSATEQRPQFDRKLATGALFRAELASRMAGLGFGIEPAGPYFAIRGVTDAQRAALSARSREIDRRMREAGVDLGDAKGRQAAALDTRRSKAEPPLPELLASFERQAAELGITPASVAAMRARGGPELGAEPEPFAIDRAELLSELTASSSCATGSEALAAICARAAGRWPAARCVAELGAFLDSAEVVRLGRSEGLDEVFTSKAARDLEAEISQRVFDGAASRAHRIARGLVDAEFDRLEAEMSAKVGSSVRLSQQREAAAHLACGTGRHAFVEGWAGAGKTTMLRAAARAWAAGGFAVQGCCQSAAAAQSLSRESGIPSRTIASLLLGLREGRLRLTPRTVLVLDESGMVGSREFGLLQEAALAAGAKLACVGDPKQLQPIEAGGICGSLAKIHGKAEISKIQRQRTDFEPLLAWLEALPEAAGALGPERAAAIRELPEDARMPALEAACAAHPKLARGFELWRARFDHEWLREAVELCARGEARAALDILDRHGRVRLAATREGALGELISEWAADKTPLERKAIIAATRADAAEANARARAVLVAEGRVDDALGVDLTVRHRDGSADIGRFAPGDRVVFTMNDRGLGVANGASGTVAAVERGGPEPELAVLLDEPGPLGSEVRIPASFGWIGLGYCLTNHKAQGRTLDSARVLANPSMLDREWSYVALSRSRFATTLHVDASALGLADPESHREDGEPAKGGREAALDSLASRMRRSRAKGTTLDFEPSDIGRGSELGAEPPTRGRDEGGRYRAPRGAGLQAQAGAAVAALGGLSDAAARIAIAFCRRLREAAASRTRARLATLEEGREAPGPPASSPLLEPRGARPDPGREAGR